MDTYSITRQFADSWGLLALFLIFMFVVFWVFRPGSRKIYRDISNIPFRHEDQPADAYQTSGGTRDKEAQQ